KRGKRRMAMLVGCLRATWLLPLIKPPTRLLSLRHHVILLSCAWLCSGSINRAGRCSSKQSSWTLPSTIVRNTAFPGMVVRSLLSVETPRWHWVVLTVAIHLDFPLIQVRCRDLPLVCVVPILREQAA